MENKIIPVILAVMVGILLTGSLLVPIISDSQTVIRTTANNETAYYVSDTNIDETLVFTCDADADEFFVNGVSIPWKDKTVESPYRQVFVMTNTVSISFGSEHANFTFASLEHPEYGKASCNTLTINPDGSWTATGVNGNNTLTGSGIEWAFYPSLNGNWGVYSAPFNITDGATAYIIAGTMTANTATDTSGALFMRAAVVDGDVNVEYAKQIADDTITDITIDISLPEISDMPGYQHYETGTWNGTSDSIVAPLSGVFFAPIEYKFISSTDSAAIELLLVLPLFVIVALVIVVAGLIRSRY